MNQDAKDAVPSYRLTITDQRSVRVTPGHVAVPASAAPEPSARRRMGTLRAMVVSMVVILAAVAAWMALVPRVSEVNQPAVDVGSVARQVRQETSWQISQARLPAGWKATSVRFAPAGDGLRTWHAGYLSPEGNYVSIDQTQGATESWIAAETANGKVEGSIAVGGVTWQKLSSSGTLQRSLVSKGSGGGLTTVLSGTAPFTQLVEFAKTLAPVAAS